VAHIHLPSQVGGLRVETPAVLKKYYQNSGFCPAGVVFIPENPPSGESAPVSKAVILFHT